MKTIFSFILALAFVLPQLRAAEKDSSPMGLISALVEIKYNSEAFLAEILQQESQSEEAKIAALKNYNEVRMQMDRFIYQLSTDMRVSNCITPYKRLNKFYRTNALTEGAKAKSCIRPYTMGLQELYESYKTHISTDFSIVGMDGETVEEFLNIGGILWSFIKELSEKRGKKVDAMVEILNNLRLSPPDAFE